MVFLKIRSTKFLFSLHQSISQSSSQFPVPWNAVVGVIRVYINGRQQHVSKRSQQSKLYFPRLKRRFQVLAMRKTKLIILPTKCLNQMGFLLLFLSCPVIGDWGRIRPDSEMSQWSIQIEREGTCGLVRDSPRIKNSVTPDGLMECYAPDGKIRNNTQSLTEAAETSPEPKTDFIAHPRFPIHESRIDGRNIRHRRIDTEGERRISNARRDSHERSFRRSIQAREIRTERRAISLDRQSAFRYDERRSDRPQREVRHQERDSRERRNYRRLSRSVDRRVDARRVSIERLDRESNPRMRDNARRLSINRQEREANERGDNSETARRRTETARSIQQARLSQTRNDRRVEERRLTRRVMQDALSDARRDAEGRNVARRDVRYDSERRNSPERRMERREQREDRQLTERRSFEERMNGEMTRRRSDERREGRAGSPERRIRASNSRERDIRSVRRNTASDRRVRDNIEISRRREDIERNARATIRSERRIAPDSRRIENDMPRKQELRVSVRRMDKPEDFNGGSTRMREQREKSARIDYRIRYDGLEPLTMKNEKKWELLDGLKTWFGQKSNQEDWVPNHGDFATTCLVGAAVYFLTTRHVKSV